MKAKHLLLVAALAGILLALWILLAGPGPGGDDAGSGDPTTGRREQEAEPGSGMDEPGSGMDAELDAAEGPAEGAIGLAARESIPESTGSAAAWDASETQWLPVRVVLPAATPKGEEVHVAAFASSLPRERAFDGDGALALLARGGEPKLSARLLAFVKVAQDGTARLALPPGTDEVWLSAGGRFVYSEEPERVALGGGEADGDEAPATVELRPSLGALVEGNTSGADGLPAPGVEVELAWSMNASLQLGTAETQRVDRSATSSVDGHFAFYAVPVGRPLALDTEQGAFARTFSANFEPVAGQRLRVDLGLNSGGTVRGRVVNVEGVPLEGAEVNVLGRSFFGNPTEGLGEAVTGPDGVFVVERVTAGRVWINAASEGYPISVSDPHELGAGAVLDVGDVRLDSGLALSGTVRFVDGEPAAGARLSVDPDFSANVAGSPPGPRQYIGNGTEATADEDGTFRIAGLGEGPWVVQASFDVEGIGDVASGAGASEVKQPAPERGVGRWYGEITRAEAPADDLELTLNPPVRLIGEVVDSDGEPVPSFTVRGERAGSQWYMPPSDTETESFESDDGTFALEGLRPGGWSFHVESAGMATLEAVDIVLPDETPQRFVVHRSITVTGEVVDPTGAPVAGAEVGPELEGAELIAAMQGRGDHPSATTDGEGKFVLTGLSPGASAIAAKKDGWAPSEAFAFELAEGESQEDVRLALRVGGTISGEVYDSNGSPAKNCVVIVQLPTLEERRFTNADASGRFEETGLKPGTYQVQAFPGMESLGGTVDQAALMAALKMATVKLADGASEHVVLGAPPAQPVRVTGRVSAGDEALEGIIVSFIPTSGGGMEHLKLDTTGADGRYSVTVDEPGDYRITAQTSTQPGRQNSVEFVERIPKGADHELDLKMPMGRIVGRVVGPDGEPAASTRVTLSMQAGQVFGTITGGQYDESLTDAEGRYEIRFVRPGTYTVAAGGAFLGGVLGSGAGGSGAVLGRSMRTAKVGEDATVTLDFELGSPGDLRGIVRDASGSPVGDASIFLRDDKGQLVELFSFQATNASGTFEYDGLAPGDYTITARADGLASSGADPVRIRAGETADVTVSVDGGTVLVVSLSDRSGAGVQSQVSVVDERGREVNGMLSLAELMERAQGGTEDGKQRVGPLAPGRYTVRATAADGRSASRKVRLDGRETKKVRLRLK